MEGGAALESGGRGALMRVLIVDDEPNIRRTLRIALEASGHEAEEADGPGSALAALARRAFDLALVDLRLGETSGLDLLGPIRAQGPRTAVVVITAHATVGTAVEAMRRGAFDYLPKPFTPAPSERVLERVGRRSAACKTGSTTWPSGSARRSSESTSPAPTRPSSGLRPWPARGRRERRRSCCSGGENGTGKGVLSRAIHAWSRRSAGRFVTVNCPSLSADLLESELFGHVRGAFTGAVRDSPGKVAGAEGGTLFLDEIGDLPPPLQPKLLRFLQERRYERVGEAKTRPADVRLIAATNRDLEAAVASGSFREDLLYRLNVVELTLPSLRERSDVRALAGHLLAFFARQTGRRLTGFSTPAREAIARHPWPGNLRELRNAIERAAILGPGPEVGLADLPDRVQRPPESVGGPEFEVGGSVSLERLEVEHLRRVLARSPNLDAAAKTLGIDPSTLYRKRKQYGL